MPQFTAGPSVRVSPNDRVEFKWSADVSWTAFVEVFNTADATGALVAKVSSVDAAGAPVIGPDHLVNVNVTELAPNTNFFFRITMNDPTGVDPNPLVAPTPPTPLPPFFTGVQAIGDVFVDADFDSAVISWAANVIGLGRVDYGTASPDEHAASDQDNITDHAIVLSGLSAGTTYAFRVSNRHAIDGDALADTLGALTTLGSVPSGNRLTLPVARPRVIHPGDVATLSVLVRNQAEPVPGVRVQFAVVNGTAGGEAISDATGKATIWMQGVAGGLVRVRASSADAVNRVVIPVVVRRS